MAPSGAPPDTAKSVNAPSPGQATIESKTSPQNGQSPKKKLKLNVRKAPIDPDTIAVSRPKRKNAGRTRYSEEVVISEPESEEVESLADSSELSSLSSKSLSEKADSPAPEKAPAANRQKNYGDFASYYIMDADDAADEEPKKEAKSKPAPKSTKMKLKARQSIEKSPANTPNVQPKPETTQLKPPSSYPPIESHRQPVQQPVSRSLPPPQLPPQQQQYQAPTNAPPPMPTMSQRQTLPAIPHPQPPVMEEIEVLYHGSVTEMVTNLQDLSKALTSFGGVSTAKKSPSPQKPTISDHDVLLAILNDDSDSNEDDGEDGDKVDNDRVRKPGEQDAPLTYGIQFIMNALKSWAQQRLYNQYMHEQQRLASLPQQAGGAQTQQAARPIDLYNLDSTAEGKAILAFRRVVQSGCLQVNAILPRKLSDALRCLYVQIDVLINSGNKGPEWPGPKPYGPQLAAHDLTLKRHIAQQNQAAKIAREQQYLANQRMMHQMGMQPVPHGHMQQQQYMPQQIPHDSQRRRSSSHAHHQRSQRPTPQGTPQGFAQSPAHANGPYPHPPQSYPGTPVNNMPPQHPASGNAVHSLPSGGKNTLNKIQMYTARANPLGMKFSFATTNPAAVQMFGAQAFPAPMEQGSNLPNRGPMTTPQPLAGTMPTPVHNPARDVPRPNSTPNSTPNGNGRPASKRGSMASSDGRPQDPTAFAPPNGISASQRNSVSSSDGRTQAPIATQPKRGRPTSKRNSSTSNESQSQRPVVVQKSNGFTPVNRPKSNGSTTSSAIVVDADADAPPTKKRKSGSDFNTASVTLKDAKNTMQNGTPDAKSGFPHPGAVVIDE